MALDTTEVYRLPFDTATLGIHWTTITDDSPKQAVLYQCKVDVLAQAFQCQCWGVKGHRVIVSGNLGRVLFEVLGDGTADVVEVSFVPHDTSTQEWHSSGISFWVLKRELSLLGRALEKKSGYRVKFDTIFSGDFVDDLVFPVLGWGK